MEQIDRQWLLDFSFFPFVWFCVYFCSVFMTSSVLITSSFCVRYITMNPCIIYTWKKFHNAQMHPNFSNPQEVAGFDLLSGSPLSPSAATATNSSSKLTFSSYLASVSPPTFAAPSSRGTKVPVFCRGHATYKSPCPSVCHTLLFVHYCAF